MTRSPHRPIASHFPAVKLGLRRRNSSLLEISSLTRMSCTPPSSPSARRRITLLMRPWKICGSACTCSCSRSSRSSMHTTQLCVFTVSSTRLPRRRRRRERSRSIANLLTRLTQQSSLLGLPRPRPLSLSRCSTSSCWGSSSTRSSSSLAPRPSQISRATRLRLCSSWPTAFPRHRAQQPRVLCSTRSRASKVRISSPMFWNG
mmetsp:Transcript_18155/g.52147  ORF Transcript_18155/g.52147 Transcript_18155/m.52147 type:complete len:203 (+) Transcript_18155:617-1225(+)